MEAKEIGPEKMLPDWRARSLTGLPSVTALSLRSRSTRLVKAEKRPAASSVIWLLANENDVVVVANPESAPALRLPTMPR